MRDLLVRDVDKRLSRFLQGLQKENPAYVSLLVVDTDGKVIAAAQPLRVGVYTTGADWLTRALAGESSVLGPSTSESGKLMEFAAPIRHPDDPQRIIGALWVGFDWQQVDLTLTRQRRNLQQLGAELDFAVIDEKNTAIAQLVRAPIAAALGENVSIDGWQQLLARLAARRGEGFVREPSAGALVGYAPITAFGREWTALTLQPEPEAFAPVTRMLHRWITALSLIVLLTGIVATVLAGRMSRPLRRLTQATYALGAEPTPLKVPVETRDEIGQLASSFNAMVERLDRAQADLLAASRFAFIGEMAAGIAHEIRTPLSVLRSSAQVLHRAIPDAQGSTAELVQVMVEEVDRLDRVVEGLLQLARPRPPMLQPTDLARLLERAADFARSAATEKGVTIERDFRVPALVQCDADQIYQAALNLIVNAISFAPPGSRVELRTIPGPAGRGGGFEVQDHGPGIPIASQAEIFTPFFTTRPGGTGLGLALVDRTIRSHHGEIRVISAPGEGAIFRILLPAAEGDE